MWPFKKNREDACEQFKKSEEERYREKRERMEDLEKIVQECLTDIQSWTDSVNVDEYREREYVECFKESINKVAAGTSDIYVFDLPSEISVDIASQAPEYINNLVSKYCKTLCHLDWMGRRDSIKYRVSREVLSKTFKVNPEEACEVINKHFQSSGITAKVVIGNTVQLIKEY